MWLYSKKKPCHVIGSQTFKPLLSLQFELLSCTFSIHEKVATNSVPIPFFLLLLFFFLTPNFEARYILKDFSKSCFDGKGMFLMLLHFTELENGMQSKLLKWEPHWEHVNLMWNFSYSVTVTSKALPLTGKLHDPKSCVWCRGRQMGRSCFSGLWHTTEEDKMSLKCQISVCECLRVDWLRFWSCIDEITWEKSEVLMCIRGRFLHVTEGKQDNCLFPLFFIF